MQTSNNFIPEVLHPRHKLTYFKNARWPDNWIQTAETIVRDEFARSYQPSDLDREVEADINHPSPVHVRPQTMFCLPVCPLSRRLCMHTTQQ
ncbi:hypothetical protein BU15DRAFT_50510 [Melanogaster broomeanus]|nr:hypothetical protein BU15DRAFT_51888 [Melanogaster broomeanus]KAF9236168.1 hypothetical protein BU15DRAFT_50510 [Melanogaster broomeanus]